MTIVALQGSHFDEGGFFEVVEAELLTGEFLHVLHHSGQSVNEIDNVIALIENDIDIGASLCEPGSEALFDDVLHQIRMWLIAHLENVVLRDFSKSSCGGLQIVEGVPHISLGCEDDCFQPIGCRLELFRSYHLGEALGHLFIAQFCEADNSTSRLYGLN